MARLFFLLVATSLTAAPGYDLAPRPLAPTTYHSSSAVTAFAAGRFLTVWTEWPDGSARPWIYGTFTDERGRRLTDEPIPLFSMRGEPVEILGTGTGYVVFLKSWNLKEAELIHLDLGGRVIARRALEISPRYWYSLEAAWNGTHFLVVPDWTNAEGLLLDSSGNVVRAGIALEKSSFQDVRITTTPAGAFVVVSTNDQGLFLQRVTEAGLVAKWRIDAAGVADSAVTRETDNGDTLLVWARYFFGEPDELHSALLSPSGEVSRVHTLLEPARHFRVHDILRNGDGFTVTVVRDETQYTRSVVALSLGADGSVLGSESKELIGFDPSSGSSEHATLLLHEPGKWPVPRVAAMLVSADGDISRSQVLSTARARQFQPLVGAGGGSFLAAWHELAGDQKRVRTATIDPLGRPLADYLLESDGTLPATALAWNGTEYLVVTRSGTTLFARRVSADGIPAAEPIELADDLPEREEIPAAATWAGDRWVVIWPKGNMLTFARIGNSGQVTTREITPPTTLHIPRYFDDLKLAWDGRRLLLLWSENQPGYCSFPPCQPSYWYTAAVRVDRAGNLLDATPLLLEYSWARQGLATSGDEFLIVRRVANLSTALFIDANGPALRITKSRPLFNVPLTADVAWDGVHYVVGMRYHDARGWFIGITRLDRMANLTGGYREIATLPSEPNGVAFPPGIASDGSIVVIVIQEVDETGARARIYSEHEMLLADPPEPPRRRSARK